MNEPRYSLWLKLHNPENDDQPSIVGIFDSPVHTEGEPAVQYKPYGYHSSFQQFLTLPSPPKLSSHEQVYSDRVITSEEHIKKVQEKEDKKKQQLQLKEARQKRAEERRKARLEKQQQKIAGILKCRYLPVFDNKVVTIMLRDCDNLTWIKLMHFALSLIIL